LSSGPEFITEPSPASLITASKRPGEHALLQVLPLHVAGEGDADRRNEAGMLAIRLVHAPPRAMISPTSPVSVMLLGSSCGDVQPIDPNDQRWV
jgi:hypothetical protein